MATESRGTNAHWLALATLGVAALAATVVLPAARSAASAECGLPDDVPLWVDYGEGSVPPAVRDVLARPGVVLVASGTALPREYRRRGAASAHFERNLPRVVGVPAEPADPASIVGAADALYDRAVASTECATPIVALNELFGAGLPTPWSATNTVYRANVLGLVRRLRERGAAPVLLIPGKPDVTGAAAQWWRDVAAVSDLVYEAYYNAVVIDRLGRIVGPRRIRLGMRSVVRTFTDAGVPVERLGFMLGFQVAVGAAGREGLKPSSSWLRVVKWHALAARQVAADTGVTSIWSWGWGTFGPESTDDDKPLAACVYLWSRDPGLCDGPGAAGPGGLNPSRVEGAIALPAGATCVMAAGKMWKTSETALERLTGDRHAALTALFGRRALMARVPVDRDALLAFEQRVIDREFGGSRGAYLAELTARGASLAVARGAIGDELRRRAVLDPMVRGEATVLEWSATAMSDESDTATCANDELPGTGDFPSSNKSDIGVVPLLARLPFLIGDRTPPSAPTGVSVAGGDANTLAWEGGSEPDLAGYYVFRRTAAGTMERLTELPFPWETYVDRSAPPGANALYLVRAVDASGNVSRPVAAQPSTTG